VGAAAAVIAGFKERLTVGLLLGVPLGVISAWPIGLRGIKTARSAIPPAPRRALARDARAFWTTALAAGLAAGAFGFAGDGLSSVIEVKAKLTFPAVVSDGLMIRDSVVRHRRFHVRRLPFRLTGLPDHPCLAQPARRTPVAIHEFPRRRP
jgi:hypothetical protein